MAVSLDAKGTVDNTSFQFGGNTRATYNGMTVGSGLKNSILLFAVCLGSNRLDSVADATWDPSGANQPLSFLVRSSTNFAVELWGLVAPVAGNKPLQVDISTANPSGPQAAMNAISFTGVKQTGSFTHGTTNAGTASTASLSQTIDSPSVDAQVAILGVTTGSGATFENSQWWTDTSATGGIITNAGEYALPPTGTSPITMGWTGVTGSWDIASINLVSALSFDMASQGMMILPYRRKRERPVYKSRHKRGLVGWSPLSQSWMEAA